MSTAFWGPFLAKTLGVFVFFFAALVARFLLLPLIPEGRVKSLLTRNIGGDRRADGSLRETVFHRFDRAAAKRIRAVARYCGQCLIRLGQEPGTDGGARHDHAQREGITRGDR